MPESIPVDAFYDLTLISEIAISPSGDRVAFIAADSNPEEDERVSSLFVVPTDGSRDPHRLTRASQASNPTWGPDGDRLGFLAARDEDLERQVEQSKVTDEAEEEAADEDDENGEEEPKSQLWYFDLALGGDAIQVTDRDEGVSDFDWSPDGDRLVFSARDPTEEEQEYLDERREGGPIETERLQHKVDGVGWTDTVTTYLFVTDIEGEQEPVRLDDAYGGGAFQGLYGMEPTWGPNDRIAFTSCRVENSDDTLVRDLYTIDPDGSDLREHTDADLVINGHEWAPSGEQIAFIASDPDRWYAPSEVYLLEDDEYESITADLDRTMAWGAQPNWIDDETLYTRIGDEGHTRLVRATTDGSTWRAERVFGAQGPYHALGGFEIADGTAVLHLSHPNEGSDLHAVDAADLDATAPEDVSLTPLTGVNDDLIADYAMPECLRVTFESDGWDIDGIVYYPDDFDPNDPDPRPLVVGIHGGPISYDEPAFSFDHAALTSRGYLVLRVNYRGGSSYGEQFTKELWGQWGTVEVEDIVAGVESLVDREWADPDRVFGHGFSYGGIAQGYLVTQTDLFTAAVPEHGIYDLRSLFGTDDSHNWVEAEFGLPWENKDEFDAASSITDVDDLDTPLLVIGGGQDWRCPPSQSEQLYLSAKKQGIDSKLVVYPDEHHNIGDPDRATHRLEQIFDWYERHDPAVEADEGDSAE